VAENERVQKVLLLMLSATIPAEIIAARDALVKLLREAGSDIHALVGQTNGLSEAEMTKLYAAGFEAGMRAVEQKHFGNGDFYNTDGMPAWDLVARFCQRHSDRLRDKERQFINDIAAKTVWGEPTAKQQKWLRSIFHRLGGKLDVL
jgi:hypothetical protein